MRVIDLPETSQVNDDDYIAVDSLNGSPVKVAIKDALEEIQHE